MENVSQTSLIIDGWMERVRMSFSAAVFHTSSLYVSSLHANQTQCWPLIVEQLPPLYLERFCFAHSCHCQETNDLAHTGTKC